MTRISVLLRDEEAFNGFFYLVADRGIGEAFTVHDVRVAWGAATIFSQVVRKVAVCYSLGMKICIGFLEGCDKYTKEVVVGALRREVEPRLNQSDSQILAFMPNEQTKLVT